jgi:hypothetical protein
MVHFNEYPNNLRIDNILKFKYVPIPVEYLFLRWPD